MKPGMYVFSKIQTGIGSMPFLEKAESSLIIFLTKLVRPRNEE